MTRPVVVNLLARHDVVCAIRVPHVPLGESMDPSKHLAKLAPEVMRTNLMRASLFLAAYEFFKVELTDRVRDFYATDVNKKGRGIATDEYKKEVLGLAPAGCPDEAVTFQGSCTWWVKNGTLRAKDPDDVARIRQIKDHRNDLAHELPKVLLDASFSVDQALFTDLRRYITSLGRFWGRIAIDTDSRFDGQNISDDQIDAGPALLVEYMTRLVEEPGK